MGAQRHALETVALVAQFLEALAVRGRDFDQLGDVVYRVFHVIHLGRRDFQGVDEEVVRQHHAIAVQYQAAIGHDGHQRDAVALGQRLVVLVFKELQVEESTPQDAEAD